jgi:hypothetical protein
MILYRSSLITNNLPGAPSQVAMRKNAQYRGNQLVETGNLLKPISCFLNVSWGWVFSPRPAAFLPILSRLAPAGFGLRAGRLPAMQLAPPVRIDAAQLARCAGACPGTACHAHQVLRHLRQSRWLMLPPAGCPRLPCCGNGGVHLEISAPPPALFVVFHMAFSVFS